MQEKKHWSRILLLRIVGDSVLDLLIFSEIRNKL